MQRSPFNNNGRALWWQSDHVNRRPVDSASGSGMGNPGHAHWCQRSANSRLDFLNKYAAVE